MKYGQIHKKTIAVVVINLILLLPLLLKLAHLPAFPLAAFGSSEQAPAITVSTWFDKSFQEAYDKHWSTSFGGRDWYVRSYNQVDFSLFKKANARYVVVGKNNCLYESGYLDAYAGKDFVGDSLIQRNVDRLRMVQEAMLKQGKLLLPVIAPGKASYYPEYIPKRYAQKFGPTNYDSYRRHMENTSLIYIDFRKWFLANKSKSPYPLYPLSGIHWSNYGAVLSFDSIMKVTSHALQVNTPRIAISSIKWEEQLQYPDNDIAEGLNLLYPLKNKALAYPNYLVFDADSANLNVITIADSFWWYLYSTGLPQTCFKNHSFWYYNELQYPESDKQETNVKNINYFEQLRNADVVMVLYNESNLHRFSDGAIEMCYETFCKPSAEKERMQQMKEKMCADAKWYQQIKAKAVLKQITVDSMLSIDAKYMLEQLH